jgi:hypothetical protein
MLRLSLDGRADKSVHGMPGASAGRTKPETIMPKRKKTAARKTPSGKAPSAIPQTKQEQLLALLRQPQGTTIKHAAKTLDWQPHSVRGIISGVLKKRLGLTIISEKEEGGRVYRVASAAAGKPS